MRKWFSEQISKQRDAFEFVHAAFQSSWFQITAQKTGEDEKESFRRNISSTTAKTITRQPLQVPVQVAVCPNGSTPQIHNALLFGI